MKLITALFDGARPLSTNGLSANDLPHLPTPLLICVATNAAAQSMLEKLTASRLLFDTAGTTTAPPLRIRTLRSQHAKIEQPSVGDSYDLEELATRVLRRSKNEVVSTSRVWNEASSMLWGDSDVLVVTAGVMQTSAFNRVWGQNKRTSVLIMDEEGQMNAFDSWKALLIGRPDKLVVVGGECGFIPQVHLPSVSYKAGQTHSNLVLQ